MASRPKRRREEFDPNKSDPEDLDFGAPSPSRPRRSKGGAVQTKKPRKRQKLNDSDEDEGNEDELSEVSLEEDSEEPEKLEVNPRTGRSVRSAAKKVVKYEEKSEDDISEVEVEQKTSGKKRKQGEDNEKDERGSAKVPSAKPSLIVKLKYQPTSPSTAEPRNTQSRVASKDVQQGPTPELVGRRRSSRLSHDESDPIVALTDSGRHVQVVRPGTRSPEPLPQRPRRGGKGIKAPATSAIMEASQEGSGNSEIEDKGLFEQLQEASQEDIEAQVQSSDNAPQSATQMATQGDSQAEADVEMGEGVVVEESVHEEEDGEGEEEGEESEPVNTKGGRALSSRRSTGEKRVTRSSQKGRKAVEDTSDFEPAAEEEEAAEENVSSSDDSKRSPKESPSKDTDDSSRDRRPRRLADKTRASQRSRRRQPSPQGESDVDQEELAEEVAELNAGKKRKRRTAGIMYDDGRRFRNRNNKPDYRVFRPELLAPIDDDEEAAAATTPSKTRRTGYRSLFSTLGPFGGAGGPTPVFGGSGGIGATGGVGSDSSDDEGIGRGARGMGGMAGMTPTAAIPQGLFPQLHNTDAAQGGTIATPTALGKVKDRKALADADPLGVDQNVNFDGVGGLESHINQLKEMVTLPLLYPEVFQRFHVTPPRGVLFHGPPGTGKTLLARALANSVSSQGRKVTFYMRKGADALSKWVGEAEKQLRLLFEEARKNQPSIIFFDEIDGLAPVRSSKQEQIHASIVATLLALMDGMDGRGQVIVIGATNRPDSVDPALRRPGRFDREFYFPLPNLSARRAIIDIHTKGWDPPLKPEFKDKLAELTKGYGGADLRALCTEAALNAVQGTYPQIYQSNRKLIIDPNKIEVLAKDFMISVNKMIPSSERSTSSGTVPLDKSIEPLLRRTLNDIARLVDEVLPQKKKLSALEEAEYDDRDDDKGFERETMQQEFERSRVFRPRLLIRGLPGMGQQYIAGALLNKFERLHVQSFDLSVLLSDPARSPEAAVIQLFNEVKRHKPGVIYIPNIDVWYDTVGASVMKLFTGLLRSLPPTDPVLLLGVMEKDVEGSNEEKAMIRDLFGFATKNVYKLRRPDVDERTEFFGALIAFIRTEPNEFPDPENRKKREIPKLEVAPEPPPPSGPTQEQLRQQRKHDRLVLSHLKTRLQLIMDWLKKGYKRFRTPAIDESQFNYLFDEQNPDMVTTDIPESQRQLQPFRPYEIGQDDKGVPGLREVATGKFYYNLEIVTIEKRLSNGYYKRPRDFLADIKRLVKDARTSGDEERIIKANEMLTNVEVDIADLTAKEPVLVQQCEQVYEREQQRAQEQREKAKRAEAEGEDVQPVIPNVPPYVSATTTEGSGPIVLGAPVPGRPPLVPITPSPTTYAPINPSRGMLSNGTSTNTDHYGQSNGSTVPSRPDDDAHMADIQDHSIHAQRERGAPSMKHPSGPNTQTQLSQKTAFTPLAQGSQAADYHNSASTTTSGQKTSNASKRSSDRRDNTQSTNGTNGVHRGSEHPDFSIIQPLSGGSQYPDTQGSSSISFPFAVDQQPSNPNSAHTSFTTSFASDTTSFSHPEMQYPSSQSQRESQAASQPASQHSGSQASPSSQPRDVHMPPPSAVTRHTSNIASLLNSGPGPVPVSAPAQMPVMTTTNQAPPPPVSLPYGTIQPAYPQLPQLPSLQPSPHSFQPQQQPQQRLIIDETYVNSMHLELVRRSSGLSVEQLEQVNAVMMDAVWKGRREWNRTSVAVQVIEAFNREVVDIERCQRVQGPSQ